MAPCQAPVAPQNVFKPCSDLGAPIAQSGVAPVHTTKLLGRIALSLLVSGLFVWLSLRHTDVRAVAGAMAAAGAWPLLGYLGILLIVHLVRTVRWGLLLETTGHVGFKRLNSASAIGYMLLMVLPLRLGEFARLRRCIALPLMIGG